MRSSRQFPSPRRAAQLGLASAAILMLTCLVLLARGSASDRRALAEHRNAAARQAAVSRPQKTGPAAARTPKGIAAPRPLTVAAR
jgi:hypothetical protein